MSRQYILEEWVSLWQPSPLGGPEDEAAAKQFFFAGAIAVAALISRAERQGQKQFQNVFDAVMDECASYRMPDITPKTI